MQLDRAHFSESHFELVWPKGIFSAELDRLLRVAGGSLPSPIGLSGSDWHSECQLLIEEAFRYEEPRIEFNQCTLRTAFGDDDSVSQLTWLRSLREYVDSLPRPGQRRPSSLR